MLQKNPRTNNAGMIKPVANWIYLVTITRVAI